MPNLCCCNCGVCPCCGVVCTATNQPHFMAIFTDLGGCPCLAGVSAVLTCDPSGRCNDLFGGGNFCGIPFGGGNCWFGYPANGGCSCGGNMAVLLTCANNFWQAEVQCCCKPHLECPPDCYDVTGFPLILAVSCNPFQITGVADVGHETGCCPNGGSYMVTFVKA